MPPIPLNRLVAFGGPYVSALAGVIASWLIARVNIAGIPGLDQNNLKTAIAGGITWILVTAITWAGHSKWLTGHHIQMEATARVDAAVLGAAAAPVAIAPPVLNGNGHRAEKLELVEDPATEPGGEDDAVTDDEEFSAPPPPITYTPAEPEPAA